MAATLTHTQRGRGLVVHTLAWTSHTDGVVALTTNSIHGEILRVVTNPDDTAAPTDDYDVTLVDADGVDVLAAQGANRDTANSEHFCPGVPLKDGTTTGTRPVVVSGALTLGVTNAGSGKSGVVRLYVR